ncbi:MAG: response regulator transcription factor [Acidobacteriota bacterium]
MKVLVVDDDAELRTLIAFALRHAGYLPIEAGDGPAALAAFTRESPALVILDVNMPRLDGFEVLRRIRAQSEAPVMMLTVRSGEEDHVHGLDLGADDYLCKPFSPRTLLARVRALLRRAGAAARAEPLVRGGLELDVEAGSVRIEGGDPIRLTPLELRFLQLLFAHGGAVVPAERILVHVWGSRGSGDRQLLKQLVHRLRQKIETDPSDPKRILTDAGTGYCLAPREP